VAQWYASEWAYKDGLSSEQVFELLAKYQKSHKPPLMILAQDKSKVVGAAQVKIREVAEYTNYNYWLGGIYVEPGYRKQGIATLMVESAINRATSLEIDRLYLQTPAPSGGLYSRLGFTKLHDHSHHNSPSIIMYTEL